MKVIHACFSEGFGGLEIFPVRLAKKLKKRKDIEVLLLLRKNSRQYKFALKKNLNCIGIKKFQFLELIKIIKKFKPDIIHLHQSKDIFIFSPLKLIFNFKLVWTNHMGSSFRKRNPLHYLMYKGLDFAIAISKYTWIKMLKANPIKKRKTDVIYYGIDIPVIEKERCLIREKLNLKNDEIGVIQVSRIEEGKGIKDIYEAAKTVWNKNSKIKFFILGKPTVKEGESFFENLKKEITDKRFIFLGHSDNVFEILNAMDIAILYSHQEAFGLSMVEAGIMGLPLIGSNNAGIKEIIEDNISGFLIPPKKPEILAKKILKLAENKDLRIKFGKMAKKISQENFSFEKHIEKTLTLYKNLLRKKILIIQLKRMGDCINTEPVFKKLKDTGNFETHFLVYKEFGSLFENNPYINKVLNYEKNFPLKINIEIFKEKYDFVFDFLTNPRSQFLSLLSFSKKRVGFKRGYYFVYNKIILPPKNPEYIVKTKFRLLKFLNIKYKNEIPKIYLTEKELNNAINLLKNKSFVGIAPYSRRITRRWKKEKFFYVVKKLLNEFKNINIMFFLSATEREYIYDIIKSLDKKRVLICPETDIRTIAALISNMKAILCVDNGLKHVAISVGTPTFTLFFANNPVSWTPSNSDIHMFIQTPSNCRLCEKKICYDLRCQEELNEEKVYNEFKKFLLKLNT